MGTYTCKCGRQIDKSTNAAVTGNRQTEGCQGCPYLLPYGSEHWDAERGAMVMDVKGYECRAVQPRSAIWYTSTQGDRTGRCALHILSLDFDFLERVSGWIKEHYPEGEISGGFDRARIRSAEYESSGRYSMAVYCQPNKRGVAAKAKLMQAFFDTQGHRLDMGSTEEIGKISRMIKEGKAAAKEASKVENNNQIEQGAGRCPCAGCSADDCVCAGMLDREARGQCDGSGNCAQSSCTRQTGGAIRAEAKAGQAEETALAAPAFDYSGLDAQTATRLQNLARRARESKQRYVLDMMEIVFEAHRELVAPCDELNNKHNNQYSENTFIAWCSSIGIGKDTAYRLLQVQALMDNSSPEEQEVLEDAPAKLLYAAARPSAPPELVAGVKAGDITTHKQYQEMLQEIRARDEKIRELIEENEENARQIDETEQALKDARAREEEARAAAHRYHKEKESAEAQRNELIDRETAYITRIAELESRPVDVAVQPPSEEQLAVIRQQAEEDARQKYLQLVENTAKDHRQLQAHADALSAQIETLRQESRMPGVDTVYPMCQDYARSIATFRSTFLMVGAGLDQKEFIDCARELMDAAQELCCILQSTIDDRSRTTQDEEDLFL